MSKEMSSSIDNKEYTVEDVIGIIPSMSSALIEEYEKFESCIENSKIRCRKYHNIVLDHRNLLGNFPIRLKHSLDEVAEETSKNRHVLEEKKSEVEQLKKITEDLDESIKQKEQKVEALKKDISHLRDKTENLQEKRDKILVYKLLTDTNFCYEGDNVSGYVLDHKTRKIECFDLNPVELSQKEITEKLYEVLRKVSHATTAVQDVEMDS